MNNKNLNKSTISEVSVVIVTHDRNLQLIKCLDSIYYQSVKPAEVIVIDNTRNFISKHILLRYKKIFKNLIQIHLKDNIKLGYSRYLGLNKAKGRWVAFIDDDAQADKKWIENIQKFFQKYPKAAAVRGKNYSSKDLNYWSSFGEELEESFHPMSNRVRKTISVIGTNFTLNKYICKQYKINFDEELVGGEDIELSIKIVRKGLSIYYDPNLKVIHDYRDTMAKYFKRAFEYALFDFKFKRRHGCELYYQEYLPKNIKEYIFLPFIIIKAFITRFNEYFNRLGKKYFWAVLIREVATLVAIVYIFYKKFFNQDVDDYFIS